METRKREFQGLCNAVAAGAENVTTNFHDIVAPHLRTIMRRSLRLRHERSASGVHPEDAGLKIAQRPRGTHGNDEARADRAARRMCETLIQALRTSRGQPRAETVVESLPHGTIVLVPEMGE